MAARYYDDIIIEKINKWIPDKSKLRVLKPDETKKLYELTASDTDDQPFTLPLVALSRNSDMELLSTAKQSRSFDGLHLGSNEAATLQLNIIPIRLQYSLDIYTKKAEECDEYVRNFIFKLINNPKLIIEIPYNGTNIQHTANIRLSSSVSDTSAISERIFSGQFTRWTLQFTIQDAFLFSIPYRKNWHFIIEDTEIDDLGLEVSEHINEKGELEIL